MYICQQVVAQPKKKQEEGVPPTEWTGPFKPFMKRKTTDKADCLENRPKVVITTTIKEMPLASKLPHPHHGVGKGLMTAKGPIVKKHSPLLRKDSRYALGQLSSIIRDDDYKELGNHAMKVMREVGLFNLAQVCGHPLLAFILFPSVS